MANINQEAIKEAQEATRALESALATLVSCDHSAAEMLQQDYCVICGAMKSLGTANPPRQWNLPVSVQAIIEPYKKLFLFGQALQAKKETDK